jgi:hypothetical protein
VEYVNGKVGQVYIHPGIAASVAARQIRTVSRLDSMMYRLGNLRRLHCYADEMGFTVSERSVRQVWDVYTGATEERRHQFLAAVGMFQDNVPEEANVIREYYSS